MIRSVKPAQLPRFHSLPSSPFPTHYLGFNMKSFAAIVLGAIAFSQVALALPQEQVVVEAGPMENSDASFRSFAKGILDYLKENISASGAGSVGGVGQGGYKSKFVPGLGGGIKGNFGASGEAGLDRGKVSGDGDVGGSGSGGIGVGKGYGLEKTAEPGYAA
ncbi:hypothetical protein K7432_003217 [Basidiobolus ranarum]|uniref:Uncharacterized protein n=1 Tax=Basidiobolus ranarum TaxID=34480 RepID=A0ABR2W7H8_9FUNG